MVSFYLEHFLPVFFRYKNIKSNKKSAFYTGWRKSYGRLNKKMAESPPGPDRVNESEVPMSNIIQKINIFWIFR